MTRHPNDERGGAPPHVDDVLGGAPPHVDDVLGGAPPPPPHPSGVPGAARAAFPPHSVARLVLLLLLTPVISAVVQVARGGEGGLLGWAAVTLATTTVLAFAWARARREARRREEPRLPAVLAGGGSSWSPLRALLPFVLPFVFVAALLFVVDAADPARSLVVAAGGGVFMGLVWHLRGTPAGLALVALAAGACVALVLEVVDFVASFWGGEGGFNFWVSMIVSAAAISVVLWPWWRRLRYLDVNGPVVVAATVIGFATTVVVAAAPGSLPDGPPPPPPAPLEGGFGAPTPDEAARRLYVAWRVGDRAAAAAVASQHAVDALFTISPSSRDRFLGCGTFPGTSSGARPTGFVAPGARFSPSPGIKTSGARSAPSPAASYSEARPTGFVAPGARFSPSPGIKTSGARSAPPPAATDSECRIESVHAGMLSLGWRRGGDATFWIDRVGR